MKNILRFATCGSVDDGKSTLIGRLLYESLQVYRDQFLSAEKSSKKYGTQGDQLDFALLVDGLQAEREQGITIDVAYRTFSTNKRSFIIADTPGHEQYTRNMATGASTADIAVVLINAQKGILSQTCRHTTILSLLGIRHIILAVNKMDLVDWSEEIFNTITKNYKKFTKKLDISEITSIPLSALNGENVATPSTVMNWYCGPTLLESLESIDIADNKKMPFRMPVQWVNRPNSEFRGYSGTIASGEVKIGDTVLICSSNKQTTVTNIIGTGTTMQPVTLTLSDEIDIDRRDIIACPINPPDSNDQFSCHIVWMNEESMLPKRSYLLKIGTNVTEAQVTEVKYKLNIENLDHIAAKTLKLNDIAYCNIALSQKIFFEPYKKIKEMGGFILIDKYNYDTVAAGMIDFGLYRGKNITPHKFAIDGKARAFQKQQQPCILWLTGLSGSGKTSIANALEKRLYSLGVHSYILDGDNLRHGINKDIGFTQVDRVENVRRVIEITKLFIDAGLITIVSLISPFRHERKMARDMIKGGRFIEVFIDCPFSICEERDPKGLYKKARIGKIKNFTGIDSPYEPPKKPEIRLKTDKKNIDEAADEIVEYLYNNNIIQEQ